MRPLLNQHDFDIVGPRSSWKFLANCTWVVKIEAVGRYFSDVTGWPPSSLSVGVGVLYRFIPHRDLKRDPQGRELPQEYDCHVRWLLSRTVGQDDHTRVLSNPADRKRRDIWWVNQNGSNAQIVAPDIAMQIGIVGIPWLQAFSDLKEALDRIDRYRDCYNKFYLAAAIAGELGEHQAHERYQSLLEAEAESIHKEISGDCVSLPFWL